MNFKNIASHSFVLRLLLLSFVILQVGCGAEDEFPESAAQVRLLHLSSDAPIFEVTLEGRSLSKSLDFGEATSFKPFESGLYNLSLDEKNPVEASNPFLFNDITIGDYEVLTQVVLGNYPNLRLVPIAQPKVSVGLGYVRIQMFNGAELLPSLDVYVSEPGAPLASAVLVEDLAYSQTLDLEKRQANQIQVRAAQPGTQNIVFNSGAII